MFNVYKKILKTFCPWPNRSIVIFLVVAATLTGCQNFLKRNCISNSNSHDFNNDCVATPRTERELMYEKGAALFSAGKFNESNVFFMKLIHEKNDDVVYELALWRLNLAFERMGEYDKSIYALLDLEQKMQKLNVSGPISVQTPSKAVSAFRLRMALIKNYLRLENTELAVQLRQQLEATKPLSLLTADELFQAADELSFFSFNPPVVISELQFFGQNLQKYFIVLLESPAQKYNLAVLDILMYSYEGFFKLFSQDRINHEMKKQMAISLLDQLRQFDLYQFSSSYLSTPALVHMANYSRQKQKFLTDWLHQ